MDPEHDGTEGEADIRILPEMRDFLNLLGAGLTAFDPAAVDVAAFRQTAAASRRQLDVAPPDLAEVQHIGFATSWGSVPAQIFRPKTPPRGPALVYLHGGGWVIGSVDTHRRLMAEYAAVTGYTVIGLDYALAPERPFPAAVYQCVACLAQIRRQAAALGIDPDRIAAGGDSAGANLAVALSLACRDFGMPGPTAIISTYGTFDTGLSLESHRRFDGDDLLLSSAKMAWFIAQYLPDPSLRPHPLAALLRADLGGLPPTYLSVAEIDVLADESVAFAEKATQQSAGVTIDLCPGTVHGFLEGVALYDVSRAALRRQCDWLQSVLSP